MAEVSNSRASRQLSSSFKDAGKLTQKQARAVFSKDAHQEPVGNLLDEEVAQINACKPLLGGRN